MPRLAILGNEPPRIFARGFLDHPVNISFDNRVGAGFSRPWAARRRPQHLR
jgi:hypothetical protein